MPAQQMCTFFGGDAAHPLGLATAMTTQRGRDGKESGKRSGKGLGKANPAEDEAVYQAILHALLEGKLRAGARLAEPPLAEIFGVSRERIRKVLHRLGAERGGGGVPNRGARVPRPTLDDVRSVYEAHRVLEAGALVQLIRILDDALFARLDAHLIEERSAANRGD